jgi:hypothetical protein
MYDIVSAFSWSYCCAESSLNFLYFFYAANLKCAIIEFFRHNYRRIPNLDLNTPFARLLRYLFLLLFVNLVQLSIVAIKLFYLPFRSWLCNSLFLITIIIIIIMIMIIIFIY